MIPAVLTGAVAAVTVTFAWLIAFWDVRDAERRCADARVDAANKAGQLAIAAADVATQKNRADDERRRADALDEEIAKLEASTSADRAGALDRLLSSWRSARAGTDASAGVGQGRVSSPPATVTAGSGDDPLASRT